MQTETEGSRREAALEASLPLALPGGGKGLRNSESADKGVFQLEVTLAGYSPGLRLKFQFRSYS